MKICIISCNFGKSCKVVFPAVKNYDAYFFSNNIALKKIVEKSGWKFIYMELPLSDDISISSLQSKYIKFLQFIKDGKFACFKDYNYILYTDHKLLLKKKHIIYLIKNIDEKSIILRDHPSHNNIWEEVGAAMFQERYLRFMPQTIDYIRHYISQGYSEKTCIYTTGIILYKTNNTAIIDLTDKVYNDLIELGTSECQIIWAIVAQKYRNIIKVIKWDELNIIWEKPEKETVFKYIKLFFKSFVPYGLLELYRLFKKRYKIRLNN